MTQAKQGDTVKVHYTGQLEDGTVFDSSREREPLQFALGKGEVIPGFEQAVLGMKLGESKTATIPPDQAYGAHRPEIVVTIERGQFPTHLKPKVGEHLEIHQENGENLVVTVTDVAESSVTLDANHPLAGKALTFDIQLVEIA